MRGSSRFGTLFIAAGATVISVAGCSSPGGSRGGDTAGAAGPHTCQRPLGSIVVVASEQSPARHQDLPPVAPLIGVLSRQSKCFLVAARGKAIEEAALREQQFGGADARGFAAADYSLTTAITFLGRTGESKIGALLGGANGAPGARLLPGWSGLINQATDATLGSDEADVVLSLVDNRSGFEIGAAQGSATASSTNITGSLAALWSQDNSGGTASTYQKTPEARLFSAAVMDGFGKLVASVEPGLAYRGNGPVQPALASGDGPNGPVQPALASGDGPEGPVQPALASGDGPNGPMQPALPSGDGPNRSTPPALADGGAPALGMAPGPVAHGYDPPPGMEPDPLNRGGGSEASAIAHAQ